MLITNIKKLNKIKSSVSKLTITLGLKKYKNFKNILLSKLNYLRCGDSLMLFIWLYKSTSGFRRVSKKDFIYYGRVAGSIFGKYFVIFSGRCIKFLKKNNSIWVRTYCKSDGISLLFFLNSFNFINFFILNYHKKFKYLNSSRRSSIFSVVEKHIRKLKRLRIY